MVILCMLLLLFVIKCLAKFIPCIDYQVVHACFVFSFKGFQVLDDTALSNPILY